MARRLFDLIAASCAFIVVAPTIVIAVVAIRLSSRGPVFYRAKRVGRNGHEFTMYKLRTMHVRSQAGSSITSSDDPRVFAVGRLLRSLKIDELPQLLNILRGDMSIVGPRPEAPDIVQSHYTAEFRRTLEVRPGLTSPGSVFYYRHGEHLLQDGSAEQDYVGKLLPLKMQQDLEWLENRSFGADIRVIGDTVKALIEQFTSGRRRTSHLAKATPQTDGDAGAARPDQKEAA